MSASVNNMGLPDDDQVEYEDYQIDVQEKWDMPKKNVSQI